MKTPKLQKVPVSERALVARVNRKLAAEDKALKRCRQDSHSYYQLGDYYMVGYYNNAIYRMQCNLEQEARDLGVLKKWEMLAE